MLGADSHRRAQHGSKPLPKAEVEGHDSQHEAGRDKLREESGREKVDRFTPNVRQLDAKSIKEIEEHPRSDRLYTESEDLA